MSKNTLPPVGLIGLGIIGSRVAANLRKAGVELSVWSRTPKPEPGFLGSIAAVAANSKVVQIFVHDDGALGQVIEELLPAIEERHVICCHSTVSPAAVKQAATAVQARGAGFLEAPFTGSRDAAAAGKLAFYVSGEAEALEKARAVLEINAAHLIELGSGIGTAAVLKIATNMISATTVCILAEALALSRACGVDDENLARALAVNGCRSPLTDMKLPAMRSGDYSPHFSLGNMLKDAGFALELAEAGAADLAVLRATAERLQRGVDNGSATSDYSVVMRQLA